MNRTNDQNQAFDKRGSFSDAAKHGGSAGHRISSHHSPEEIRHDIGRTRAEMDGTLNRLQRLLSPNKVMDSATAWLSGHDGHGTFNGKRVAEIVRRYPVQTAMISGGIIWLVADRARGPRDHLHEGFGFELDSPNDKSRRMKSGMHKAAEAGNRAAHEVGHKAASAWSSAKHGAESAADSVRRAAHSTSDGMHHGAGELSDAGQSARQRAGQAAQRVRQGAADAGRGARHAFEEHPLMIGAAAVALGILAGLAIPATRREDKLMGHASDEAADKAEELASEATHRAGDAVRHIAHDAKDAVDTDKLQHSVDDAATEVKHAAKTATATAREEMRPARPGKP